MIDYQLISCAATAQRVFEVELRVLEEFYLHYKPSGTSEHGGDTTSVI